MDFVIINVHEYYGNDFCRSRKAKYFEATRKIEYLPEPDYPDDETEEIETLEEDEEDE